MMNRDLSWHKLMATWQKQGPQVSFSAWKCILITVYPSTRHRLVKLCKVPTSQYNFCLEMNLRVKVHFAFNSYMSFIIYCFYIQISGGNFLFPKISLSRIVVFLIMSFCGCTVLNKVVIITLNRYHGAALNVDSTFPPNNVESTL